MSEPRPTPEDIEAFVAGELDDVGAERVRSAMMRSDEVAAEIEACMQLRAVLFDAASEEQATARAQPAASAPAPPDDPPADKPPADDATTLPAPGRPGAAMPSSMSRRWWRRGFLVAVPMFAAAAALAVHVGTRAAPRPTVQVTVADDLRRTLPPDRNLLARLSWPAVDDHRPYEVMRAAGNRAPVSISYALLARVEALGDPRALTAVDLLQGHFDEAEQVLARAPGGADGTSDRAAIALVRGDAERALRDATAALRASPDHRQARWNRALALEQLGLDQSAAAFDEVAAAAEPGWADEARARAAAIRDRRTRAERQSAEADVAGQRMIAGDGVPTSLVATFPDRMRLYLYDAVRAAGSRGRVEQLRPLASALDAQVGGQVLAAYVDRIAAADFRRRARLARRYEALLASRDPREAEALVHDTQRTDPDLALGALLYAGATPGAVPAGSLPLYASLAGASDDPWFALAAAEQRANLLLAGDDAAAAESVLTGALPRCRAEGLVLRCQRLERLLIHAYLALQRIDAARDVLGEALRSARASGDVQLERNLLRYASTVASRRDDLDASWQAVADAYLDEWARRDGSCGARQIAADARAMALVDQRREEDARALLEAEPPCDQSPTLEHWFVLSHLVTDPVRIAATREQLAARRVDPRLLPYERVFLDHIEGRLLLDTDPPAARALLRRAIASATGAEAARARAYSYDALIDEAAGRQAWDEAIDLFAEASGLAAASPCTLGVGRDRQPVAVARGLAGHAVGARGGGDPGGTALIAPLLPSLAGCDVVTVFGRGPYQGQPRLLPPELAWSYRVSAPHASVALDGHGPTIVVAQPATPARLGLPPLAPVTAGDGEVLLDGAAADPDRVLTAIADASYVEVHAHGMLGDDASLLILSPDEHGRYGLTAAAVSATHLRRHPVVVLAACHAAIVSAAQHTTWGLADAFIAAGARAVIASPDVIADADAARFFAAVRRRILAGAAPASALRDERLRWTAPAQRAWIDPLMVFE